MELDPDVLRALAPLLEHIERADSAKPIPLEQFPSEFQEVDLLTVAESERVISLVSIRTSAIIFTDGENIPTRSWVDRAMCGLGGPLASAIERSATRTDITKRLHVEMRAKGRTALARLAAARLTKRAVGQSSIQGNGPMPNKEAAASHLDKAANTLERFALAVPLTFLGTVDDQLEYAAAADPNQLLEPWGVMRILSDADLEMDGAIKALDIRDHLGKPAPADRVGLWRHWATYKLPSENGDEAEDTLALGKALVAWRESKVVTGVGADRTGYVRIPGNAADWARGAAGQARAIAARVRTTPAEKHEVESWPDQISNIDLAKRTGIKAHNYMANQIRAALAVAKQAVKPPLAGKPQNWSCRQLRLAAPHLPEGKLRTALINLGFLNH